MRRLLSPLIRCFIIATALGSIGCATIRTMPTLASYGSPKVYSGARLDFKAATGDTAGVKKFKVEPPDYPLVDILFSAALDTFILPLTLSVATYEVIFER